MSEPLQFACDEHGWCDYKPCPTCHPESSFAAPTGLEPATETPRTMRCWRDGRWHADELANLAAKLECENAELQATINTLHGLCVSAEKRAFQKLKEEAAAAGSNEKLTDAAVSDAGKQK